jgi:Bacterial protein of unknown function (Gcw_chp)
MFLRNALLTIFVIVMFFFPVVQAQIIAESAVVTDYMWRGFNVLNGAPAIQPTVTGIIGDTGFDVNAWFSFALRDRDQKAIRDLDEMDLTLTYSRDIGIVSAYTGLFTYHLFTHDDYPDSSYTFVKEAFAGVALTQLPFSPWVTYNYELDDEWGNDWYLETGLEHVLMFGKGQPVILSAHAGWYSAEWAGLAGQLTEISLTTSLPIESGSWMITPWMTATHTPPEHINPNGFEIHGGMAISGVFLAR